MTPRALTFAVPGDLATQTGGYIYDRRLIHELGGLGWQVTPLSLPGSFPAPPAADMAQALAQLEALPPDQPVIIDGLAFGALDPRGVARLKAPLIAMVHHPLAAESGLAPDRETALRDSERRNLAQTRHVLVPSPHTARILSRDYAVPSDRITIARPGIDRALSPPAPIDPPLILSVGIQVPRKGHDVLLRALAQITDLPWQARIIGAAIDPNHSAHLVGLCQNLRLADRVTLAGQVPDADLATAYAQASIFALATRYEGHGLVFDEALTHALPIISCDAGAVPDTVPPQAGTLVPVDDPETFAAALRHLLEDTGARAQMADAARTAGAALPSWAETARTVARALTDTGAP